MVCCELLNGAAFERKIYSIDSRFILPHFAARSDKGLVLEWYVRVGEGSMIRPRIGAPSKFSSISKEDELGRDSLVPFPSSTSNESRVRPSIKFEVRYASSKGEQLQASTELSTPCGLQPSEWVCCRAAALGDPPTRGSLEVWAIMIGLPQTRLECHGLCVSSLPPTREREFDPSDSTMGENTSNSPLIPAGFRYVGGDVIGWSAAMNSLVSKRCLENLNSSHGFAGRHPSTQADALKLLPRGHVPIRALQWTEPFSAARLRFTLKLSPVDGIGVAMGVDSEVDADGSGVRNKTFDPYTRSTPPMDHHCAKSIGYVWRVSIYGANGSFTMLDREGECLSQNQMDLRGMPQIVVGKEEESRANPLIPWMWRSFSLDLGRLFPNDVVVLSGIATGDSPSSSAVSRCALQAKDCQLLASIEDLRDSARSSNICAAGTALGTSSSAGGGISNFSGFGTSVAFAIHNDPRVRAL